MKTISIITAIITGVLLLSTLICGLWIKSHNIVDTESIDFHIKIGAASVLFGLASIVLLLFQIIKH